mgnify:CR=1 FL=1
MGAVSVSYPFTLINAGSAAMLGVGSASVLSRAIGKKDQDTIKKIMGNLIAMVLLLSVIYTVIGMVFTRQLLSLAGASDNILNYAEKYLRIVFAGSLFVNFFQSANITVCCTSVKTCISKAETPTARTCGSNSPSICIRPIFTFMLFFLMGVGSASVLSRAIGKKDQDTVKKIMGNLIAMVLLLSPFCLLLSEGLLLQSEISALLHHFFQ